MEMEVGSIFCSCNSKYYKGYMTTFFNQGMQSLIENQILLLSPYYLLFIYILNIIKQRNHHLLDLVILSFSFWC
jgi:hypothetical protein